MASGKKKRGKERAGMKDVAEEKMAFLGQAI